MSKFSKGDHVRITNLDLYCFDEVGVVTGYDKNWDEPASWVLLTGEDEPRSFKQSSFTLADPDVHTVLDQMDAESAADAFTVGERVMVKGHVGSHGGRFGMIHGRETDSATQWLVRLDGNPVSLPFSEDELTRPHIPAAPFDNDLPNRRAQVLRTAESLVNGQRADDYGPPAENFGRVAAMWTAQFAAKLKEPLTADEVAIALVHLKLSRLANTPDHADSWIDACGYLALGAEIAEGL